MQLTTLRFWRGCAWGLVATLAMTAFLLLVWLIWPSAVPDPLPHAITIGLVARVFGAEPISPGVLLLAMIIQFAYGAFWSGLLEVSSRRVTAAKGIVLGLGLWLIMIIFYMPMAAQMAFSFATKPGIWISTLIGHVIYGYTAGALLARDQRRLPEPLDAAAA